MLTAKEFKETKDTICNSFECGFCPLYEYCAHGFWADKPIIEMIKLVEEFKNKSI